MTIELSPKVASLLEQVLSKGGYRDAGEVLEHALTELLERHRRQRESIRRMAQAADDAGLYDLDLDPPMRRHD